MKKKIQSAAPPAPAADLKPHVIDPSAAYSRQQFEAAFALTKESTRREVRLGRLKVARRGGRYWILGEWIIDWLRGGELQRRPHADQGGPITPDAGEPTGGGAGISK